MENMEPQPTNLPEHLPLKFRPDQVEGRLSPEELEEYNRLTDALYGPASMETDISEDDPRHERWLQLAKQADVQSYL